MKLVRPALKEFQSDEEKESKAAAAAAAAAASKKKKQKKTKKKVRTLTPDDVEMILSYGLEEDPFPLPSQEEIDQLVKDDNLLTNDISVAKVIAAHIDDCTRARHGGDDGIRALQERIRHEVLTIGHVTYEYEATDDEAEDADEDGA